MPRIARSGLVAISLVNCICTHSPEAHDEDGCLLCPCFKYRPCRENSIDEFDTEVSAKLSLHRMPMASPHVQ